MGEQNDSLFPRFPIMEKQEVQERAEDISQAVYSLIVNRLPWECIVEYKERKEKIEVWELAQEIEAHVYDEIVSYYSRINRINQRSKSCEENM